MLAHWDAIDWKRLEKQDATPPVQRAWFDVLVNPKSTPAKAQNALRLITIAVFDQGCVVHETSAMAIGLLVDTLSAGCRAPVDVLHLIGDMAGASARFDALDGFDRSDPHWAPLLDDPACKAVIDAVDAAFDALLPLLGDKSAKTRAAAAYALAFTAPRAKDALPALRARLPKEKDPSAAASMLLALANHLAYAKEPASELARWTSDERELVALTAAIAVARRLDDAEALADATRVLLRASGRIARVAAADAASAAPPVPKKPKKAAKAPPAQPTEALPLPAFRFAGGNVEALALATLARLGPRDATVAQHLLTLLDDETPLGGSDWFATRTTARVVAAAIAGALPLVPAASPNDLEKGSRAVLGAFAVRPWVWSGALRMPPGVPTSRLALARWLGLRPSRDDLYGRPVGEHGSLGATIKNALDEAKPLEPFVASIAGAVSGEEALDVVEDLCAVMTSPRDLPWWFEATRHDGSIEQIRRWGAEGGRRRSRAVVLAFGLLRARGAELEPHLRRAVRGVVGHSAAQLDPGTVAALAWGALDALSGGREPIPDGFWSSARHVMSVIELVPVFSAGLARIPVEQRIVALQLFSVATGIRSDAWLYADQVPLPSIPALVRAYSMRPDDVIFPAVIERMRAAKLAKEIDEVLAWGVERFGTAPQEHWSNQEGIHPRAFRDGSGTKEVTLHVAPTPRSPVMSQPSWPRAEVRLQP